MERSWFYAGNKSDMATYAVMGYNVIEWSSAGEMIRGMCAI
jgi:hypothetical protein